MTRRVLSIMDALESLKPHGDSSLALLEEAKKRKYDCFVCTSDDLASKNLEIEIQCRQLTDVFENTIPEASPPKIVSLKDFDFVLIRKDPPFNHIYTRICWLLIPFEKQIRFFNRPSLILRYHEKLLPHDGVEQKFLSEDDILPFYSTSSWQMACTYVDSLESDEVVLKPFYGFAGSEVHSFKKSEFKREAPKYFKENQEWILQPFIKEARSEGDRRVFFVGGKYLGSFVRMPAEGSFVSNLAQGGSAVNKEPSQKEMQLIKKMEPWIKKLGLDFVGADFLGSKLNEVNITSPTGIRSLQKLTGKNIAQDFWNIAEELR